MNITVLDDYQHTVRTLPAFQKVAGHQVTIWNDHTKDIDVLAERLKDTEALALIRERTPIRAPLLDRLNQLRIIEIFPDETINRFGRRSPTAVGHGGDLPLSVTAVTDRCRSRW
jgi:hypothetical protein